MRDFSWQVPTQIFFGRDVETTVGEKIRQFGGSRVLLHYGSSFAKKSGLIDRVAGYLKEAGLEFWELGGVKPNPRLGLVYEGIELCRKNRIDFVLAVGGGSVIDSSKAIAMGTVYDGDVWDLFLKKCRPQATLPVGSILTIPAAGSEVSVGTVITNEKTQVKTNVNNGILRPKFALMNPQLTCSLSPHQTASGIADMMSHVMECYFTHVMDVDFSDRMSAAALKTMINNGRKVMKTPQDYNVRAELMWSASVAMVSLYSCGRSGDWTSHDIGAVFSGIYDLTHGDSLAILKPAWMRYVYKHNIPRFLKFAVDVWDVDPAMYASDEEAALEGINRTEQYFRSIGLPTRLHEAGIPDDRLEEIAELAVHGETMGSFVKLTKEDVLAILRDAY